MKREKCMFTPITRIASAGLLFLSIHSVGYADMTDLDASFQGLLDKHYEKYNDLEYFSGAELSVYLPNQAIKNYYVGRVSHEAGSDKISASTLFQIGSITKSFTAATVLQLEKEHTLSLNDPISKWLSDYNKWSDTTIETLLNMTSNLPNYSDTPLWNTLETQTPERVWSEKELINFVYPKGPFTPPLKQGYFYSNTGYILTAIMIEKITQHSFQEEIENRLLKPADLKNTYYPIPNISAAISNRIAHGYNYNQYDNPELVGTDVSSVNLSWAGAAGAMISNSEDIIKWVNALFVGNHIIDVKQKMKLMTLVSTDTGKPISKANKRHPRAFGLGVVQSYSEQLGRFWFYEGQTLGFRALYVYIPCNGIIISSIFNSSTNAENDHASELITKAYDTLLRTYPQINCKS